MTAEMVTNDIKRWVENATAVTNNSKVKYRHASSSMCKMIGFNCHFKLGTYAPPPHPRGPH